MTLVPYRFKKGPRVSCTAEEATENTTVMQGDNPHNRPVKVKKGQMIVHYPTCSYPKVFDKDVFLANYETEEAYQKKKETQKAQKTADV